MLSRLSVNTTRKLLLNTNISSQRPGKCMFSCLTCNVMEVPQRNNYMINVHKHSKVIGIFNVRHQSTIDLPIPEPPTATTNQTILSTSADPSTGDTVPKETVLSGLPDIPDIPYQEIIDTVVKVHPNGEPTFASLGLCANTPVGLVQSAFECLHITLDMPWWGTIVLATVIVRVFMFPLVVTAQRNAIRLSNHGPEMLKLQTQLTEARNRGNEFEASMVANQLAQFMKSKQINPIKNLVVAIIQAPIFISIMLALRNMTNVPVESLKTGGLFWFTDLTIYDPYYIMPVITCASMYAMFQFGVLGSGATYTSGVMKYFVRGMPIIALPFIAHVPSATLCYWIATNCISLVQIKMLRINAVRKLCNLPEAKNHEKIKSTGPKKGFVDSFNESWTNVKISKQLQDKTYADSVQFAKAGKGPIQKTFKYDPTRNPPTAASILAKKR